MDSVTNTVLALIRSTQGIVLWELRALRRLRVRSVRSTGSLPSPHRYIDILMERPLRSSIANSEHRLYAIHLVTLITHTASCALYSFA